MYANQQKTIYKYETRDSEDKAGSEMSGDRGVSTRERRPWPLMNMEAWKGWKKGKELLSEKGSENPGWREVPGRAGEAGLALVQV